MDVTCSKPPVERPPSRMAMTFVLPSLVRVPARPPRLAHFGIRSHTPVHPLSTLQTPRYRDARTTHSRPACSALAGPDFHWQADISFPNAPRTTLFGECFTAQREPGTPGMAGPSVVAVAASDGNGLCGCDCRAYCTNSARRTGVDAVSFRLTHEGG